MERNNLEHNAYARIQCAKSEMKMSHRIRRNMIFQKFNIDMNAIQNLANLLPDTDIVGI